MSDLQPETQGSHKGTLTSGVLEPGAVFPDVPHSYSVYHPATGLAPFPLSVFLDGMIFNHVMHITEVLDRLIDQGAIPPMVAVFVDPGMLTPPGEEQQTRMDRGFEYDGLNDRIAKFLETELLPAVSKQVELSSDPDQHAIFGCSSSSPGALVTAWHRPDLFRRVGTFIGSYLDLRGASHLAALIRKGEPRPLKVWLFSAESDHRSTAQPYGTYWAGDWPAANAAIHSALLYRGYQTELVSGVGEHDLAEPTAKLAEALSWIWQSAGEPIQVEPPAAWRAAGWETRGSVWDLAERVGNAWELRKDWNSGQVRADLHGRLISHSPVLAIGPANQIIVSEQTHPDESTLTLNSKTVATLPGTVTGLAWDGADIVYSAGYDTEGGYLDTVGLRDSRIRRKRIPAARTGGIALSADRGQLLLCDPSSRFQWSFVIGDSGQPIAPAPYYLLDEFELAGGARDVATDTFGRAYFATLLGVQVCEPIGRVEMHLAPPLPGRWIDSLAIGGPSRKDLFVVQSGKLYRRRLTATGSLVTEPVKPPTPLL
jgi:enterochelin esterase-like enzyme